MRNLARVGVGESQRCGGAKGGRFPVYPTQELWELFVIALFPLFTKFPSIYFPGLPNRSTLFPRPPEYLQSTSTKVLPPVRDTVGYIDSHHYFGNSGTNLHTLF